MLKLAIRHLLSKKKQTLFTFLGIMLSAVAYVVISGILIGFREYFVDQLINNDAQIRIYAKEDLLETHQLDKVFFEGKKVFWYVGPSGRKDNPRIVNPLGWQNRLRHDSHVQAFSPQLTTQVIVTNLGVASSVRLLGSYPEEQQKVTNIGKYMTVGAFKDIGLGGNRIIVGKDLLKKIGARVFQTVMLSSGKTAPKPYKIVGVFKSGIKVLDEDTIFGYLVDAQRLNQSPNQINEIAIRLKDVSIAKQLALDWTKTSDEKVQSWDQINKNLLNVFQIQDRTRAIMVSAILLVAGFGIYNVLTMTVTQKRKEIAILRSMGFEAKDILSLFLTQGILLGVSGGIVGLFVGYMMCRYLSTVPFSGGSMGSGTGTMTVSFNQLIYMKGFALSFFSAVIASFIPAYSAGKLTPIDIIRSES